MKAMIGKKSIFVIMGLITILGISSFALFQDEETKPPIKIGISFWAGDAHAFLAQELDLFEKNGVHVELVYFEDYADIQKLYSTNKVDGIFGTLSDAIYYTATDLDSRVVYLTDISNDADVIVGKINSLNELRGKTIAVENINSYSHIFVLAALNEVGLTENDVKFKVIPAQDVVSALEDDLIDAGHTWEPGTTRAKDLGYDVIFTAGQIPGIITSSLILNADLIEERSEDVQKIVMSLITAQEYKDNNWDDSIHMMSSAMNVSSTDLESGYAGIDTLDLESNIDVLNNHSLREQIQFISQYFLNRGQITSVPDFDKIIDARFVEQIGKNYEAIQ